MGHPCPPTQHIHEPASATIGGSASAGWRRTGRRKELGLMDQDSALLLALRHRTQPPVSLPESKHCATASPLRTKVRPCIGGRPTQKPAPPVWFSTLFQLSPLWAMQPAYRRPSDGQ